MSTSRKSVAGNAQSLSFDPSRWNPCRLRQPLDTLVERMADVMIRCDLTGTPEEIAFSTRILYNQRGIRSVLYASPRRDLAILYASYSLP